MKSKSFRKLIFDNNGFYINKEDIDYIELWYEWNFIRGKQEQINKKWVNNIYNERFRPLQKQNMKICFYQVPIQNKYKYMVNGGCYRKW